MKKVDIITSAMAGSDDVIRSRANPIVKRLRALASQGDPELALLEGEKLVREALAHPGLDLEEVALTPRFGTDHPLLAELRRRGIPVRVVAQDVFAAVSPAETSQGVLAVARRRSFDVEAVFAGVPLLVVGVGVQNPGNLGGLLRTAEAAGATGALLTEGCADPFSWKALRGSMGSAFRLPHLRQLQLTAALDLLARRRVTLLAAASDGRLSFDQADYRGPVAILVGSEGAGLPDDAIQGASLLVRIPMAGAVESLNVGVAAGLLLYEAARQRGTLR